MEDNEVIEIPKNHKVIFKYIAAYVLRLLSIFVGFVGIMAFLSSMRSFPRNSPGQIGFLVGVGLSCYIIWKVTEWTWLKSRDILDFDGD